ncbi:MAG TPA: DUF1385 domain-containing protein [Acidimicrobiales bacterium]|nr:DUF1385 domain-containing protein [Acidimicrobiales bacterium]
MSGTVRIGGQALADGVLMRTERAWAIARADGTVEVGAVPRRRFAKVPVVRFLVGLVSAFALAVNRGLLGRGSRVPRSAAARRGNLRFLAALAGVEVLAWAVSSWLDPRVGGRLGGIFVSAVPWVVALAGLRLAAPAALWRYHGAEHKAVAAHEAGVAMDDLPAVLASPRVHDRCGTNLVVVVMVAGVVLAGLPGWIELPAFLVLMASAAEVVTAAAGRPRSPLSRAVLAGGRTLQRLVTTAEPTPAEQAVGCRALAACLAHHQALAAVPQIVLPEVALA